MRHVPPAVFPGSAASVWRALRPSGNLASYNGARAAAVTALTATFGRAVLACVDSGTSALRVAITAALAKTRGAVAIPGYGCIDVPTAVMGSGACAIPYDLDADSLAPDASSVLSAINAGATVVVACHLFGHPADLRTLRVECDRRGVVLIEDAAQWAGARLGGQPLGILGHLSVLSLGRGKGLVGTGGGILLGDESFTGTIEALDVNDATSEARPRQRVSHEWSQAAKAMAAIALGRPSLYVVPASIPSLRLGEMVFHPPQSVRPISGLALRMLPMALQGMEAARARRQAMAERLLESARRGSWLSVPHTPQDATPGYLRLVLRLPDARALPAALGVVRPYPRALHAQQEVRSVLRGSDRQMPMSDVLATRLITVPVHDRVSEQDEARLRRWLEQAS